MKKAVLILLGAMLVPTQALAAEVSDEKQAQLAQNGWTVKDESAPVVMEAGLNDCFHPQGAAARKIATGIWYDTLQVRVRVKLVVCAWNGRVTRMWVDYAWAAPGRHWWSLWGPNLVRWKGPHGKGVRTKQVFNFDGVILQQWSSSMGLGAHVKRGTDHRVWFSEKRRWF